MNKEIEELFERHNIPLNVSLNSIGVEHILPQHLLNILKFNFTNSSLDIRNTEDIIAIDTSSRQNSPIFIEHKKERCKTVELTQLIRNQRRTEKGITVYYSLGKDLLIPCNFISKSYVIVSPNSKKYYDEYWKDSQTLLTYYRNYVPTFLENGVTKQASHDPHVYVNYNFLMNFEWKWPY